MNIEQLKNHLKKRKEELSAEYKKLEEDLDKMENLARQSEVEKTLLYIVEKS